MRSPIERTTRRRVAVLLLLAAAAGCRVTAEDIDEWKGTVKGPGKIVAVLLSERYPLELRAKAAVALVEMDRSDVDGVAELGRALGQIKERDEKALQELLAATAPKIVELLRQPAPAGEESVVGPPEVQVRAKDAAYKLLHFLGEGKEVAELRNQLVDAILDWYVADFNGRSLAGTYSAEQIVEKLRGRAAAKLVESLDAKLPPVTLVKISELISRFGGPKSKRRAAQRLIEIEKEMFSKPYLDWMREEARKQFEKAGRKPSKKQLEGTVRLTRNKSLRDGVYPAMKHLASDELLAAYLLELASLKGKDEFTTLRREWALKALAGNVRPEHADKLVKLAVDRKVPATVRAAAFELLPETRNKKIIPKLWPIVEDADADPQERGQAGAVVLTLGGPGVVSEFLRRLPTKPETKYDPEELAGYAQVLSQMSPLPKDKMRKLLSSEHWWARVLALRFFERRGDRADMKRVEKLVRDTTPLVGDGWAGRDQKTVGDVAKATLAQMKTRLNRGKDAKKGS